MRLLRVSICILGLNLVLFDETEEGFAVCVGMEGAEDSQHHPAQQRILETTIPILQLVHQVPLCVWSVTAGDALWQNISLVGHELTLKLVHLLSIHPQAGKSACEVPYRIEVCAVPCRHVSHRSIQDNWVIIGKLLDHVLHSLHVESLHSAVDLGQLQLLKLSVICYEGSCVMSNEQGIIALLVAWFSEWYLVNNPGKVVFTTD